MLLTGCPTLDPMLLLRLAVVMMFVMGISAGCGWPWQLVAVFASAVAQVIGFLHEATKTAMNSHL